jgi:hypothetical protein
MIRQCRQRRVQGRVEHLKGEVWDTLSIERQANILKTRRDLGYYVQNGFERDQR